MEPAKKASSDPAQEDPVADDHTAELEAKIAELTEQLKKMTELAGRSQADLQNARQRMGKDSDDMRRYAAESVIVKLLPTIDNFQRAFQHLPEDLKNHEWVKGVLAMEQGMLKQLTDMGLKKMDALGQVSDPQRHEILILGPGKEGEVIEVLEDGYLLHDRVIRPAKVKVGGGEATSSK